VEPYVRAPERYRSYWAKSAEGGDFPALARDRGSDVAVIGGGIVGVTAALALAEAGAEVVLLEARRIGSGASGYNTAKISSLHGLTYSGLARLGWEAARDYGEMNETGLAAIAANVERFAIDCDFRRKPNFTYTEDEGAIDAVREEAETAARIGLPSTLAEGIAELPFPTAAAVRFDDQAEFHPLRYLHRIAASAAEVGAAIHERTRVVSVDQGSPCELGTESGRRIRAGHVIVATHLPILDRGLYFARTHPERSYALLARLRGAVPQGMYLSDERPAHSMRAVPTPEGELLLVGGESHKAGQGETGERYAALERWARERFEVASIEHRWATQDHLPHDGLPFIGRLWPLSDRILTATGMKKWGMAMGTAAAGMLADRALGREEGPSRSFAPERVHPIASAPSFLKQNADDGLRFFAGRLRRGRAAADLGPGEAEVAGDGLAQVAAFRDEGGELHALSARCTHLGCIVRFNSAERTWDCPCHGSRFGLDGEVIEGPAVNPLERRD